MERPLSLPWSKGSGLEWRVGRPLLWSAAATNCSCRLSGAFSSGTTRRTACASRRPSARALAPAVCSRARTNGRFRLQERQRADRPRAPDASTRSERISRPHWPTQRLLTLISTVGSIAARIPGYVSRMSWYRFTCFGASRVRTRAYGRPSVADDFPPRSLAL